MFTALIHGVLSILALLIGVTIIVWVLYNEFVQRLPGFQRGGLGIGPIMVIYGVHWGRQALAYLRGRDVERIAQPARQQGAKLMTAVRDSSCSAGGE